MSAHAFDATISCTADAPSASLRHVVLLQSALGLNLLAAVRLGLGQKPGIKKDERTNGLDSDRMGCVNTCRS